MVGCLNQSSKHCGKMPRQQKTDYAKALANLAFWAVLTGISLPVLRLTLLQRLQQGHWVRSFCVHQSPTSLNTKISIISQVAFSLDFYFALQPIHMNMVLQPLALLQRGLGVPNQKGEGARSQTPCSQWPCRGDTDTRDSTNTAAIAQKARQPHSLSGTHFSACSVQQVLYVALTAMGLRRRENINNYKGWGYWEMAGLRGGKLGMKSPQPCKPHGEQE